MTRLDRTMHDVTLSIHSQRQQVHQFHIQWFVVEHVHFQILNVILILWNNYSPMEQSAQSNDDDYGYGNGRTMELSVVTVKNSLKVSMYSATK